MSRRTAPILVLTAALLIGCSSTPHPYDSDHFDVTLSAPTDDVRTAVAQVLTDQGYDVQWKDDQTLSTGYRDETGGPWNGLLHWRFGTLKSRVEVLITPSPDETTRLRLQVLSKGKDGLFTAWETAPSALPQSAGNQLRLIKNALHLL
jgi:hypothetical protein